MELKLTFFSDTHMRHAGMENHLSGGDILFFMGDCGVRGNQHEIHDFLKWFGGIDGYDHKVMIAGNHDWFFEWQPEHAREMVNKKEMYGEITYLQDESVELCGLTIYGSPWQPAFCNWAFNLPRNGTELQQVWSNIPTDTDVLLTHGPPYQILDYTSNSVHPVGCEKLQPRVFQVNPIIHAFGHIHDSWGEKKINDITFINGTIMDETYKPNNKPITVNLNKQTREVIYE